MIIVGGANGSGKTTFAGKYDGVVELPFLNADNIAKQLADQQVPHPLIAAGREFFVRLNNMLANRRSFIVETTLSGTYVNKVAVKAKKLGYSITLVYIFLDDPQLCTQRVRMRVKKGGHDVPRSDIYRRFYRSLENFRSFVQLTDRWHLYYNGGQSFNLVALGENAAVVIQDADLYEKFYRL
jgi:predicted ABC-type ATPase